MEWANRAELVKMAFRNVGGEGKGKIRRATCVALIKELCPGLSQEELDMIFESAKVDADGLLEYDEWVEWLYDLHNDNAQIEEGEAKKKAEADKLDII